MSAEAPWLDAPIVEDDPEPWKAAPIVEDPEQPWLAAPVVGDEETKPVASLIQNGELKYPDIPLPTEGGPPAPESAMDTVGRVLKETFRAHSDTTKPLAPDSFKKTFQAYSDETAPLKPGSFNLPALKKAFQAYSNESVPESQRLPEELADQPIFTLPTRTDETIPGGISRSLSGLASGLTTPNNLAILIGTGGAGPLVQQAVGLGFGAVMLKESYNQLTNAPEGETPSQKAERVTTGIASLILGSLAAKHGVGSRSGRLPTNAAMPTELPSNLGDLIKSQGDQNVSPEVIDGLFLAKAKMGENFFEQPKEIQEARRNATAEIDEQLALMDPAQVAAAEARVRERTNAGAAPQGATPIPPEPLPNAATPAPLAEPAVVGESARPTAGEALVTETAAPATTEASTLPPAERTTPTPESVRASPALAENAVDVGAVKPEGSGAKLGPGAANIEEPLASYELRKFGERFVEDKTIDPTIREQTGNRYYEPLPNRVTAEEATRIINERGLDEVTSLIRDEKNDVSPAVRSTMGQVVIKRLNESYRALKETNPAEASKVLDKAVDLAEWQMEYGTRLGQGVQSFAMWSRLTPEGKLRTYVKSVDKARVRVEKETGGEVKKVATAAKEVSERTESKAKVDAIEREADRIAKHLSDTPDFKKAKVPNEALVLIREHLKTEVPDFTTKLSELGAKPETAAQIDRMAAMNRKRIAAIGREQRIEALRKRLTAEKNATGKKLKKSTVERLIELADDGLLKDAEVWNAVSKDLGLPEYTPAVAKEMGRLAAEVDGAAEGMPRNEAMQRLTNYMASQKGFSPGDLPLGIYYGNILSGYNTHIVNAVDTGLNVFSELGNMALSNPKEIPSIVRGVIRGLGEGKSDAILALSEGRRITEGKYAEQPGILEASKFGKEGGVPIQTKGIVGKALKYAAESKVAAPLNAYKYVGRLMAASDTVFFRAAEEARAAVLAFREAQAKGVEKANLRAEADKLLGYDRIDEFREQAKAEGYTGNKAEARTTELMIQTRPEALRESAADFAGEATYNHAPEGLLGYAANTMAQVTNKVPALKLIVPFTRIVANVTNRGLDWTPWGYKRALAGRTFGDGPMFGEARTAALTKATVGMIGLTTVGILNQLGVIQLHGGGPSDTEKKKQLQAAGWKPYTIQIGDTYISYLPTPLGLGLSTLANYLDADRYQELKQKDAATRTTYAVSRIASTVFNQSFLSGLSNLFEALSSSSPGKQIASMKQMFSRISAGFAVPNIARDVNRIFDPSYRDSNSIAEDLVRDIPVIRLALNPTLNAFGEPAEQPKNRFVSVRKSSPEWRLVVDKNLRIPVADDTVFTDPQAGYEYQKLAGEGMKAYVSRSLSSLKNKTTDEAQEEITQASSDIFESARSRVRSKYPNSLRKRK